MKQAKPLLIIAAIIIGFDLFLRWIDNWNIRQNAR